MSEAEQDLVADGRMRAILDQLDAVDAQLNVWRPRARLVLPPLVLFLFYASMMTRSDAPLRSWVLAGVLLILCPFLVLGFSAMKARSLENQRARLLEQLGDRSGGGGRPLDSQGRGEHGPIFGQQSPDEEVV